MKIENQHITFNKPYVTGKETEYINQAVRSGHLSGNGFFTHQCQSFLEKRYGFKKTFLTTSCTDALEMCAMLLDIRPGDEVIVPSFTFVSTALAFARQGARIVFADSRADHPGIDEEKIEALITARTKAIVPVHYAGVACNMNRIMEIAGRHNLFVVEDAAQAIDSFYLQEPAASCLKPAPLGSIGHLSCFSFHETKNIHCGEGGFLAINDERFVARAETIWEKGTNRARFFRGEIDKYTWLDTGSSFLPSEITAAFLWAQLEEIEAIQKWRKEIRNLYFEGLQGATDNKVFTLPSIPGYATCNGHMFYLVCSTAGYRTKLIEHLGKNGIHAVFHYQSLHKSPYCLNMHDGRELLMADRYSGCLVRLPYYFELKPENIEEVTSKILAFTGRQ
jgi:dTDP-4-amino-4,6-dideoxygalactose transaminase